MQGFLETLRIQRWDDHRYYHHSRINQSLHLLSAVSFLTAYGLIFKNPAASALIGWLVAMVSRQAGHFFFEPKGYDEVNHATHEHKEDIKVGYNLRRKIVLLTIWGLSPALLWLSPTLFGIFPAYADRATFIQHVGQTTCGEILLKAAMLEGKLSAALGDQAAVALGRLEEVVRLRDVRSVQVFGRALCSLRIADLILLVRLAPDHVERQKT